MGRQCAFPNCRNRMVRYTSHAFHRLPYSEKETLKLWLTVLQMDPETPVEALRCADHRVCSDHFDKDDYCRSKKRPNPKHLFLRKSAVPRWETPAAAGVQDADGADYPQATEFAAVPQSTPVKIGRPNLSSSLKLTLSSPHQSTPRTKPSLSGTYFALPPTLAQSMSVPASTADLTVPRTETEHLLHTQQEDASEPDLNDMSMSFEEMNIHETTDSSFAPLSTASSSATGSASASASASPPGDAPKGWAEKKWLVNESKLMELFNRCIQCGCAITEKKVTTRSSQIKIEWNCLNGHSEKWASCPDRRGMAENNLLLSAAILFTGATYTTIAEWAGLLNVQMPKQTQFYGIQSTYLIPVIQYAYRDQHEKLMERLLTSGKKVELCGDARCDSPGYSSKYSTYTFQDDDTKEIVHFELVEVTEASSSVAMEVMGFQRGLNYLLHMGVDVGVMTTDRSPSVRKIMRETYSNIFHEFDPWHVNKSVKKKLVAASRKTQNKDLQPWVRSICNHLYWSCSSSKGDQEDVVRRWKSVLHHICGVHRWEEDGVEYTCHHTALTEDQQRRKKWLHADSSAFQVLKAVVLDKNLLRDLRQMARFKHTGSLEVYHASMLKYAEKRLHFTYDSMRARTELAIMDHNANVDRPQKKTTEGDYRYRYSFSKQSAQWVARPIYERTKQTFRDDLMERVLKRRDDKTVVFTEPLPCRKPRRRLPHNIAPVPRPEKADLLARHSSRFRPY